MSILEKALEALQPVFEEHGKNDVINAIHKYFHDGQPNLNNKMQQTLWESGFGLEDEL